MKFNEIQTNSMKTQCFSWISWNFMEFHGFHGFHGIWVGWLALAGWLAGGLAGWLTDRLSFKQPARPQASQTSSHE